MYKSNLPITTHIPDFLDYCKTEKGLSYKTQENYKRYLNKFIFWLEKKNKKDLKPNELTQQNIWDYRLFLSKSSNSLKKISQNYYLIALRALLGYFTAKDIASLPANKINLPDITRDIKEFKKQKSAALSALDSIKLEKLLSIPDTKKEVGLRDRALLETIISTGLRVSQLVILNRNDINENIGISAKSLKYLKDYLTTRKDHNKALFINNRSRRDADRRLTTRSVERIINKYGKKAGFHFLITPDILRWARPLAIINKETNPQAVQNLKTHKYFIVRNYKWIINSDNADKRDVVPYWHIVEAIINQEIAWLKDNILVLPEGYKDNPPFLGCDDCISRKIATLIVSGKIKVVEFKTKKNKDLWNDLTKQKGFKEISKHGQEWHRKMMDVISEYFRSQNYKVTMEPALNYGRADLGIYLNSNEALYIEVGTVSLFKLWYNLSTMKNVTFLLAPYADYVIEFKT